MISILIALSGCVLIVVVLFLFSKSEDPEERRNEDASDETSERIMYQNGYIPYWRKNKLTPKS